MPFRVLLTEDAVRDTEEIQDYIGDHDDPAKSDHVSGRLGQRLNPSPRIWSAVPFPKNCWRSVSVNIASRFSSHTV